MTSTLLLLAVVFLIAGSYLAIMNKRRKQYAAKLAPAPILSKGSACVWQMDKEA